MHQRTTWRTAVCWGEDKLQLARFGVSTVDSVVLIAVAVPTDDDGFSPVLHRAGDGELVLVVCVVVAFFTLLLQRRRKQDWLANDRRRIWQ